MILAETVGTQLIIPQLSLREDVQRQKKVQQARWLLLKTTTPKKQTGIVYKTLPVHQAVTVVLTKTATTAVVEHWIVIVVFVLMAALL